MNELTQLPQAALEQWVSTLCANPDCQNERTLPRLAQARYCSTSCRQHAAYLRRKAKERLGAAIAGIEQKENENA